MQTGENQKKRKPPRQHPSPKESEKPRSEKPIPSDAEERGGTGHGHESATETETPSAGGSGGKEPLNSQSSSPGRGGALTKAKNVHIYKEPPRPRRGLLDTQNTTHSPQTTATRHLFVALESSITNAKAINTARSGAPRMLPASVWRSGRARQPS